MSQAKTMSAIPLAASTGCVAAAATGSALHDSRSLLLLRVVGSLRLLSGPSGGFAPLSGLIEQPCRDQRVANALNSPSALCPVGGELGSTGKCPPRGNKTPAIA